MPKGILPGTRELRVMVSVPEPIAPSVQSLVRVGEKRAQGMGIASFAVHDLEPDKAIELIKQDILRYTDLREEDVECEIDHIQRVSGIQVLTDDAEYEMPSWFYRFFRWFWRRVEPQPEPVVQPDIPAYSPKLYYIDRVGFDRAWRAGYYGNDVLVGVNDTGCGPNSHVPYVSNLNTVGFDDPVFENDNDHNGHGTHVAATIGSSIGCDHGVVGCAPKSRLRIYKSGPGYFYTSDLIQAIDAAVSQHVAVLNNSWGGTHSKFLQRAITRAFENGTLVVKAVGNENILCPDQYHDCVMVSAIDRHDRPSVYSNWVEEEFAPNTIATYGNDILNHVPNDRIDYMTGTSMATPIVTSALAILKQKYPNYGPKELLQHLMDECVVPLQSTKYGLGKLTLLEEFEDGTQGS